MTQNDLKAQNQQLSSLRTSEKQLKQEMNHLLDMKRSLEKHNQELRKSVDIISIAKIQGLVILVERIRGN